MVDRHLERHRKVKETPIEEHEKAIKPMSDNGSLPETGLFQAS
jgi:hypothetical protein